MTDQTMNQDVELSETEIEEALSHDPKNAEAQSVASVDAAEDKGPKAAARTGDKSNSEPMPKTKAGMISAMYTKMNKMGKADLAASYNKMMGEEVEAEEGVMETFHSPEVEFNYTNELDALVESEATLSEEFKEKTAVLFETALKSKLAEEITRLEANYAEELAEETTRTKAELVEKVDSYLNYVVEQWMEENEVAIQAGLRTEIAEGFMNKLKDLFVESYVEVPESKIDLVDELADQVEELEESLNNSTARSIKLAEELELLKRKVIIAEASWDLTDVETEKLEGLVEGVDFDDEKSFSEKVAIVKEAHFKAEKVESTIIENTEEDVSEDTVEISPQMSKYLNAIRKTKK